MNMKRGTLRSFNSSSYRAVIEIAGSLSTWLPGVPVARNIDASQLTVGRKVALLLFDESNPEDCVLVAVWD